MVSVLDSIDEEAIINPDNSENDNVIDSDNELPEDKTDNDLNQDNNNDDFIVHVSQVSLNRTNIIIKVGQVKELIAKIYPYNSENKKLI